MKIFTKLVFLARIDAQKLFESFFKSTRFWQKISTILHSLLFIFEKLDCDPILWYNLKNRGLGYKQPNCNKHLEIKTMVIGSGVEAMQRSKQRKFFLTRMLFRNILFLLNAAHPQLHMFYLLLAQIVFVVF